MSPCVSVTPQPVIPDHHFICAPSVSKEPPLNSNHFSRGEIPDDSQILAISSSISRTVFEHVKTKIQDKSKAQRIHSIITHTITKILMHSVRTTNLELSEIQLTETLIHKAVRCDSQKFSHVDKSVIKLDSLATVTLVAIILAHKTLRDSPIRNSWWSKIFGIGVNELTKSEMVFLHLVDFSTIHLEEYTIDSF